MSTFPLFFAAALLATTLLASPIDRAHLASAEAFTLALEADRLDTGTLPALPAAIQDRIDTLCKESKALLFDETLPFSGRLEALATLSRLGVRCSALPLSESELPRLRNAELQAMARVTVDNLVSYRRGLDYRRRH